MFAWGLVWLKIMSSECHQVGMMQFLCQKKIAETAFVTRYVNRKLYGCIDNEVVVVGDSIPSSEQNLPKGCF